MATAKSETGTLRLLTVEDIPGALQLSDAAGWNQTADDWRMLIELAPDSCFMIEMDDQPVASTTLLCYGSRLAWVGMVLTKPEYRGRGLARRLLTHALGFADQQKIETLKLDATDQGQPIYEKVGFRPERPIERWSRPGSDTQILPSTTGGSPISESLDRAAFGVDRSQLLQKLARRHAPSVSSESFLFSRPGRNSAYLGPCVATDSAAAGTLIEGCLQDSNCSWSWDLFPENHDAVGLARALGFGPQRYLLRMVRGKDLRGNDQLTYGIAGFELG